MDALRRQQINGILNCDTDTNLRALALQRKQVALCGPEGGETGELLNQEVIDATNDSVRSLFILSDKRRAEINTMTRWQFNGSENVYGDAASNLGRISEVVDAHNELKSTYMSNNTQAKSIILSSIRRMLHFV